MSDSRFVPPAELDPHPSMAAISTAGAEVIMLGPRSRLALRCCPADIEATEEAWGEPIPTRVTAASALNGHAALCLGPDEWLFIAPAAAGSTITEQLTRAFGPRPFSLVDVSERSQALMVTGTRASELLAAGCPIDLEEGFFPPGTATRTLFGRAEIMLWRVSSESFYVEYWRSYSLYIWQLLKAAAKDM
jgi:sarcosine oxidase subunit gamma